MIDLTHAGIANDDLGQPSAAEYEQGGAHPLTAAEREHLQERLDDLRRGPRPSDWLLPLAESAEKRGQTALAAELRSLAGDPAMLWAPGETFRVPKGDQLWIRLLGLPGPAAVWVDDRRVGPVKAGADSGWAVVADLADGEHVFLAVVEPGAAATAAADRRGAVVVRLASTGQDIVSVPMLPDPTHRMAFVARFLVV